MTFDKTAYIKMKYPGGRPKALTLSYDDGDVFDIRMVEIMDRYGIKCTFNVNTGLFLPNDAELKEGRRKMSWAEAKKLYIGSSHEVAIHSVTHPYLEKLRPEEMIPEILEDKRCIEKEFGTLARGMAYPFGTYSQKVMDVLPLCGVVYSRTVKSTHSFNLPENWLEWHPTCHQKDPELMNLAKRFLEVEPKTVYRSPLFYLWGHGFEFDRDNNWELLENFCKLMGGKDDIWYCTNIQLYDYVNAYRALQISADNSIVYNPSATDVWFTKDKKIHCVHGGETLYL